MLGFFLEFKKKCFEYVFIHTEALSYFLELFRHFPKTRFSSYTIHLISAHFQFTVRVSAHFQFTNHSAW